MKKKMLSLAAVLVCLVSFAACGQEEKTVSSLGTENGTVPVNNSAETVPADTEYSGQETAESAGSAVQLEVIVRGDKTADFIFDSTTAQGIDDLTAVTVQFADDYMIGLNDFDGTGDFQCNMWKIEGDGGSIMENAEATYSFDGPKVQLTANMNGEDGFSFSDVSGDCILHYEYKDQGGPNLTLSWADVAREELNAAADGSGENTGSSEELNRSAVKEFLDGACGEYKEKQGDTFELAKSGDGYVIKHMRLVTRDDQYNDGMDNTTEFGVDDVEVLDDQNVLVTFETQMMADEGTAVINKDGYIRMSLTGPNMPDYLNFEFMKQ